MPERRRASGVAIALKLLLGLAGLWLFLSSLGVPVLEKIGLRSSTMQGSVIEQAITPELNKQLRQNGLDASATVSCASSYPDVDNGDVVQCVASFNDGSSRSILVTIQNLDTGEFFWQVS
jgi:hypothetical protein